MDINKNPVYLEELKKSATRFYIKSKFEFLNSHYGLRPEKLHTFIAPPGAGKSTLIRTLLVDILTSKKKPLLYLSEETLKEFYTEMAFIDNGHEIFKNLSVFSEQGQEDKTMFSVLKRMQTHIEDNRPDVLLLDNITTMKSYEESIPNQYEWVEKLKNLSVYYKIPVVVIAHTDATITENHAQLIDMNKVRGTKRIVNESQFNYVLQPIIAGGERFTFILNKKARGAIINKKIFQLFYFPRVRVFAKDEPRIFDEFKEFFNKRDKL